jgi:hypothetical protein
MDSVIFDHVTESLPDRVKDYPPPAMLFDAEKVGLGRHEHRPQPKAPYQSIDYVELGPKAPRDKLRQLAHLRALYRKGKKTAPQIKDLLEQGRAIADA